VSNIKQLIFPNGFRVVYEKSKNILPITSIFVFCDLGSVYEKEDTRGASHFIEHMCFKGTKRILESSDIFKEFDKSGSEYNASTYKRYTYYNLKCDNENIEQYLFFISDMILNSTFKRKEYDKELKVVIEENIRDTDNLEILLEEKTDKMIYNGSSFENPVDSIDYHNKNDLKYEKVIEIYKLFYQPNNIVLSIVSNISFSTIKKYIKKTFFYKKNSENIELLKNNKLVLYIPPNIQNNICYSIKKINNSNATYLSISFRTCNQYSKDRFLLNLLKDMLGGLLSSRLFKILREDNGLTYKSDVSTQNNEVIGDFTITAITDPSKLINNGKHNLGVLPLIIKLLNDLIKNGIQENELLLVKKFIKGRINLRMENNDTNAIYNGEQIILYPNNESLIPYENTFETYYKNITKSQVFEVIKKYFIKSNMNVCIIGEQNPSENIISRECEKLL